MRSVGWLPTDVLTIKCGGRRVWLRGSCPSDDGRGAIVLSFPRPSGTVLISVLYRCAKCWLDQRRAARGLGRDAYVMRPLPEAPLRLFRALTTNLALSDLPFFQDSVSGFDFGALTYKHIYLDASAFLGRNMFMCLGPTFPHLSLSRMTAVSEKVARDASR